MADLFVSYSREDKARAEEVVRLLEDYGWDVFWDQETRAGELWPKVLEEELIKARCLVALWTTTSIAQPLGSHRGVRGLTERKTGAGAAR